MKRARVLVLAIAFTAALGAAWVAKKIVGGPRDVETVEKTVGVTDVLVASAMRAYDQVRKALRRAGIDPRSVALEPYFGNGYPAAPVRLSYLQVVAMPPDCPDWSENIGRDPQNMPWPNAGCATQRNLAAMVANPEDLLHPRGETQRSGERRDVVWGNYRQGKVTGSKWGPNEKPNSEHANASALGQDLGGSQ